LLGNAKYPIEKAHNSLICFPSHGTRPGPVGTLTAKGGGEEFKAWAGSTKAACPVHI